MGISDNAALSQSSLQILLGSKFSGQPLVPSVSLDYEFPKFHLLFHSSFEMSCYYL